MLFSQSFSSHKTCKPIRNLQLTLKSTLKSLIWLWWGLFWENMNSKPLANMYRTNLLYHSQHYNFQNTPIHIFTLLHGHNFLKDTFIHTKMLSFLHKFVSYLSNQTDTPWHKILRPYRHKDNFQNILTHNFLYLDVYKFPKDSLGHTFLLLSPHKSHSDICWHKSYFHCKKTTKLDMMAHNKPDYQCLHMCNYPPHNSPYTFSPAYSKPPTNQDSKARIYWHSGSPSRQWGIWQHISWSLDLPNTVVGIQNHTFWSKDFQTSELLSLYYNSHYKSSYPSTRSTRSCILRNNKGRCMPPGF